MWPTLRRGDRGEWVEWLQTCLIALGFDPGSSDGVFGPRTEVAVESFRVAVKLDATGVMDDEAWAALDAWRAKQDASNEQTGASGPAGDSAPTRSDPAIVVEVPDDVLERIEAVTKGFHHLGGIAEFAELLGAGEAAPALGPWLEGLSALGHVATIVEIVAGVAAAVDSGEENDSLIGLCYGVMYEVFALPDADPPAQAWEDHMNESRGGWWEGLRLGRHQGRDPLMHNRIVVAVYQNRGDYEYVLNAIWERVVERRPYLRLMTLEWPGPRLRAA